MAVPGRDPVPLSPVPPLSARPMPWATAERAQGGCHASASITIRGSRMQRLPTVAADTAVVIAALYHIMYLPD